LYLSTTDYMMHTYPPDAPQSLEHLHTLDRMPAGVELSGIELISAPTTDERHIMPDLVRLPSARHQPAAVP
jgi:hypothetical protein